MTEWKIAGDSGMCGHKYYIRDPNRIPMKDDPFGCDIPKEQTECSIETCPLRVEQWEGGPTREYGENWINEAEELYRKKKEAGK